MHTLIISPFPLQASTFSLALKHQNVSSSIYTPLGFTKYPEQHTDCIFFPHELDTYVWELIIKDLNKVNSSIPLLIVGETHKTIKSFHPHLARSVTLNQSISLDQIPNIVKEVIGNNRQEDDEFKIKEYTLNRSNRSFKRKEKTVRLSKKEFFLLELLLMNAGHVISREKIIDYVWNSKDYVAQNTIDVYISRLRKKISDGKSESPIKTIPCLGYTFTI